MPAKHVVSGALAVAMMSVGVGCGGGTGEVSSTTDGCARRQSVAVQDGDVGVVNSLEDIGRSDGSILVVHVADEEPSIGLNEDPVSGEAFPHVITRYIVTVEQMVVWPDSVPTPAIGDEMALDVQGGTMGCFTLVVTPDPAVLDPGGRYLVAAGALAFDQLMLWDDRYAMKVVDGIVTDPGPNASLPEPLAALIGQPTTALPPLSVVESATQP